MQHLRLFGLIFAVPLGGIFTSGILATHLESQLHEALLKTAAANEHEVDTALRERIEASTIADVCDGALEEKDIQDVCGTYRHIGWIRRACSASLCCGFFLVAAPWAAGLIARSNRQVLLRSFRPGLYATLALTPVVITLHAAILIGSVFCLPERFVGPVFPWLLLWLGVGAIPAASITIWTLFPLPQRASATVLGLAITSEEQPELWMHVRRLAEKVGAESPEHIVLGTEPRFVASEADLSCLNGDLKGRTLFISLPLTRVLTLAEWDAVVAHELCHLRGLDARYACEFYPLYQGTEEALTQLAAFSEEGRNPIASFILLPGLTVLNHFCRCFAEAENRIGRERELAADAVAAEMSGGNATASALLKIYVLSQLSDRFVQSLRAHLKMGRQCAARQSVAFVDSVAGADRPKLIRDLLAIHSTDPTDSHPALSARLDALGVDVNKVAAAARVIRPTDAASLLITAIDALDEALSREHLALLAQELGIRSQHEAQA